MTCNTCNTCIYLHRNSDKAGQCRRHSPARDEVNAALFPWVNTLEDWCGEYFGNTQPLTEGEQAAFLDTSFVPVLSVKPTPYHKVTTAEEGFQDYGN